MKVLRLGDAVVVGCWDQVEANVMQVPEHVQQVSQLDRKVVGGDDVCSRVDFEPKLVNTADNARADPFWKSLELAALNVDLEMKPFDQKFKVQEVDFKLDWNEIS